MADEHIGGVIALIPSPDDLKRLAVWGGDPADELHLTLAYLGDDLTTIDDQVRDQLLNDISTYADTTAPIQAEAFAHAAFNPNSPDKDPCAVYLVNGDFERDTVHGMASRALGTDMPDAYPQFIPHITAGYDVPVDTLSYTGPITFDRVRVAIAGDHTDYRLNGTREEPVITTAEDADGHNVNLVNDADGIPVSFPVLAIEGLSTSDGRYIEAGALDHRPLPLPILAQTQTPVGGGGHDGAHVIGRLDRMERVPGPTVVSRVSGKPFPEGTFVWTGSGFIDPAAPATSLAQKGYLTGNSVDLSEVEAFIETDPDNPAPEDDAEGGMKIGGPSGERMRLTKGVIAATTLVSIPAFADAYMLINGETVAAAEGLAASATPTPSWRSAELGDDTCLPCAITVTDAETEWAAPIVASADGGTPPPIAWFRNPELPGLTPLTIDSDGRVYGHLGAWNSCHTGYTGKCVMMPRSGTDYAHFRVGSRRVTDDGGTVVAIGVGTLTVVLDPDQPGHAPAHLAAMPAAAHYDNVGTQVANVEVGEDAHGIWVAGALRSTATTEQVDALLAAPLSGDWRPINGQLELVAALGVNTPGFPIPRARVASGQVVSLVAAGAFPRPSAATPEDKLADTIAVRVAQKLGLRLPKEPVDTDTVSTLAARRAAAVKSLTDADLSDRHAAVAHLFTESLFEAWGDLLASDDETAFAKRNWVSKAGGLPKYIKRISKHLIAKGMDESRAIATAVNAAKKMCATGDVNFPGKQQVNAGSKAEACAAVADWEAKKAKS